jgi:hypothetical protein
MESGRRRLWLAMAAAGVIAVGLAVHFLADGPVAALVADALYAVMAYLIVGGIAPRSTPFVVALVAFACCAAIEFFQLTPVPGLLARAYPPSSLVLGTEFAGVDLIAYAVGAALGAAGDLVVRSLVRSPGRRHEQERQRQVQSQGEPGE